MYFLTVCLNPVIQRTYLFAAFFEDAVNRCENYRMDASGKGVNVTRVLQQLQNPVVHLTQLGGQFREYFLQLVADDHLRIEWVESQAEIRTCTTVLNAAKHTSTELVEEAKPVAPETEARIRDKFLALLPQAHTLIISGSKAAGFSDDIFPWMVQQAKAVGCTVILDYRGTDLLNSIPYKPDFIKPNFGEFSHTFFGASPSTEKIQEKMRELEHAGICTILTRGSEPLLTVNNGEICAFPIPEIIPVNTIGCGDAFTAGFAAAWHESKDFSIAVMHALQCATQNALTIRPGSIV